MVWAIMGKAFLALGVLLVGCGSSDGAAASAPILDGVWQTTQASGCAITYGFDGSKFTDNFVCQLQSGNLGMEIESGTFSATGTELDLVPTESSCAAHASAGTVGYSFNGQHLVLRYSNLSIILDKTKPGSGGGVIANGCWDTDASNTLIFTQGPITKL
jgi:hypothetical protein